MKNLLIACAITGALATSAMAAGDALPVPPQEQEIIVDTVGTGQDLVVPVFVLVLIAALFR